MVGGPQAWRLETGDWTQGEPQSLDFTLSTMGASPERLQQKRAMEAEVL